MLQKWIVFCFLLLLGAVVGCNKNGSGDESGAQTKETASAVKADTTGAAAPAEAVDENIYPDFRLEAFTPEERARLVKLTKAELCPCPDANKSLHECLQTREGRCEVAEAALSTMGGMVKGGYNDTDILDQVAKVVENATKQHEFVLDQRPVKGSADAAVIIVEFADFQCPYCKEAAKLMDETAQKYGDKVGIYFKQYPLPAHEFGELAARASIAAHLQGKFWKMHDELFKHQKSLSYDKIISIAQRLGLNMGKFKVDLESPDVRAVVAADREDGEKSGLTGTPTIFINGRRFMGDGGPASLFAAIDKALADSANAGTTTTGTN